MNKFTEEVMLFFFPNIHDKNVALHLYNEAVHYFD